jgi:hypothetical protein
LVTGKLMMLGCPWWWVVMVDDAAEPWLLVGVQLAPGLKPAAPGNRTYFIKHFPQHCELIIKLTPGQ